MAMPTRYSTIWTRAYKYNKKYYPGVCMSGEAYGESANRVVSPSVKEICKHFYTIYIPSITTTLKGFFCSEMFSSSSKIFHMGNLSYNGKQAVTFGICEENYVEHLDEQIHARCL